jgi:hypothetical protein
MEAAMSKRVKRIEGILPCPFCGAEAAQPKYDFGIFNVTCKSCLATASPSAWNARTEIQWQPIETAPKDGTEILAYWTYAKDHEVLHWGTCSWKNHKDGAYVTKPDYWLPLSKPTIK